MAYHNNVECVTFIASTDMRTRKDHVVDLISTPYKIDLAAAGGGFGVLQNKPNAGEHAVVAVEGDVEVRVGVAVTAGGFAMAAASGWVITTASTTVQGIIGRFITTAASGMLATMRIEKNHRATA